MFKIIKIGFIVLIANLFGLVSAQADRLKDLTSIAGVRSNQLIGYGLVVGLAGTGDGNAALTQQSMQSMISQFGGETYAVAQGNLMVGGLGVAGGDGSSLTVNVPTVGRIPGGASVEKMIETSFLDSGNILLNLHQGDFSTTNRVTEAINDVFGTDVATALDSTTIKVRAPIDPSQKVSFVSLLENIEVEPARPRAKVVVNARTGTIVIGGDVRVSAAAVTHGSLTVRVKEDTDITQTQNIAVADGVAATVPGDVVETPDTNIEVNEEFARAFVFDPGVELSSIVDALNAVGGTPSDLVAILEALREAGSLRAELIVI